MREVLSNTSPLFYLHRLDKLDLLVQLYGRITVPEAVVGELREGARLGHPTPSVEALSWVQVQKVDQTAVLRMVTDLDAGEREVLALALGRPGCLVLLDDGHARRYAQLLKITFTGTLGVLVRAKQRGFLPDVRPHVDRLHELGFRMAPSVRAGVLRLAGEAD